jgi:hypothetical protein
MGNTIITELSHAALRALIDTGTNRQGAVVPATGGVWGELRTAGLIGDGGGLTRAGTIARQCESDRRMNELFSL